jgi:hypothetical protein
MVAQTMIYIDNTKTARATAEMQRELAEVRASTDSSDFSIERH